MKSSEIRESLHYDTYKVQACMMKLAADQNYKLHNSTFKGNDQYTDTLNRGLFHSTNLLYAISLELVIKARILFIKRDDIKNGKYANFGDIRKEWKGHGHDVISLIDMYNIEIGESAKVIFDELSKYMVWAGRFPFPLREDNIYPYEKHLKTFILSSSYPDEIERIIGLQLKAMGY